TVYVNRYQEPAFFNASETNDDIQRYSRRIGESPRITRMPHRPGFPNGVLASWGKVELEPLDNDSIKALAEGRRPTTKGYFIDFTGNVARSAKEGLPVYRLSGGAGFVWVASYGRRGRGALRGGTHNHRQRHAARCAPSGSLGTGRTFCRWGIQRARHRSPPRCFRGGEGGARSRETAGGHGGGARHDASPRTASSDLPQRLPHPRGRDPPQNPLPRNPALHPRRRIPPPHQPAPAPRASPLAGA